ncbi:MAG: histidine phosphatase family protein [Granulosicoccus sp.]
MTTLYLVRHGHTAVADAGIIAGFTDVNLSPSGEVSVAELVSSMADLPPVQFHSSDLLRAVHTAQILGGQKVIRDSRLRELNFGDWEGCTWDQVYEQDAEYLAAWSDNWIKIAPPGGETFAQLASRAGDWLAEVSTELPDSTLVVAAHGGSIRALICLALRVPLDSAMKFSISHAHVSKLVVASTGTRCAFVNGCGFNG